MIWEVEFLPEASNDLKKLSGNQRIIVLKAIKKIANNPISIYDGGYGKPLGNKRGINLSGLFKIKLRDANLRIVYKVIKTDTKLIIIIIGTRSDDFVYKETFKRTNKCNK